MNWIAIVIVALMGGGQPKEVEVVSVTLSVGPVKVAFHRETTYQSVEPSPAEAMSFDEATREILRWGASLPENKK